MILSDGAVSGTIDNLPLGFYLVHETFSSIHGYDWTTGGTFNDGKDSVTLTHDGVDYTYYVYEVKENQNDTSDPVSVNITNEYKEWTAADFWIHKVDNGTTPKNLEGAHFQLLDADGANVTSTYLDTATNLVDSVTNAAVSNSSGMVHFKNFTLANNEQEKAFTLKEVQAPNGYETTAAEWTVKVTLEDNKYNLTITGADGTVNSQTDTITVVNQPMVGTLNIVKNFGGDALYGTTQEEVVNISDLTIQVMVTGPNGYHETHALDWDETKKQLSLTIPNLPLGTYTVTELTQNAQVVGYDLVETTYTVDGQTGNTVTFADADVDVLTANVVITNIYDRNETVINNPDYFTILKTDETGKPLSGAEFMLTNNHNTTEVRTFVTGADGKVVVDELMGNGTVTSQSSRTYTLEEIKAPVGHELAQNKTWTIQVSEQNGNAEIKLTADKRTYETIWDWIVSQFTPESVTSGGELTVRNARKTAKVTVEKTVEYTGLTDAAQDELVKEKLENAEYTFELYIDGTKAPDTLTLSAGESGTFQTEVPYGSSYEVKEKQDADSMYTVTMTNASGIVNEDTLSGIQVTAKNTYNFRLGDSLKLEMVKVSSGTRKIPLEGAKFSLYDSSGTHMGSYRSGSDGKFLIDEITAPGEYTLKETAAPNGYYALKKPLTIEARYVYTITQENGKPVIVKTLAADVDGRGVYEMGSDSYGIKNTRITSNPMTGDHFNTVLWLGIAAFSLLCMTIVVMFIPRKKGKYQQ